jgi:uncharacterized glyoxalase superfamily protein PhnB
MAEFKRPSLTSGVAYRDPKAAINWLEKAFGFETLMVVLGDDGSLGHSELRLGNGMIFVGREWDEKHRSPASLGGVNTQSIHVQLEEGLDAHCERARAAGAVITREPADQFYGDRSYAAVDPEGHVWTFAQTIKVMSHGEMSKAGGVEIREKL